MIKFFKNNSKYFYIIGSFILVLMIAGMGILIGSQFVKKTKAANTYTLTVERTSTVSIYVSGKGVTPDPENSNDNFSSYLVEQGTTVSIRAVNESRIFDGWDIDGTYTSTGNLTTDVRVEVTPSSDLTIETTKRNALTRDFGEYMNSKFSITLELHLMYLQRIFDAGTDVEKIKAKDVLDAYDYFFNKYTYYESLFALDNNDAEKAVVKANSIINDGYFTKIQNGYFSISSSFSLLNDEFTGIGNETYPFNGVLCGNSNGVRSTVFVTSSNDEVAGEDMYRGLFQVTGVNAVIRNINIRTSFGIIKGATAANNIYVGGIAGYVNNSVITEVDVLARIAIDSAGANIHAGGVAGKLNGGLDKGRNVLINGKDTTFILTTDAASKNIYAGLVTGNAENVYVKEANIDSTNFAISAKNTATNTYGTTPINIYLGNLFGKYTATQTMPIEEVNIHGTSKESITSLISSGNSYIGGLIGHLTVSSGTVELGDVSITNTSGESKLSGSSVDKDSEANILTAGLIACVVGDNLHAKEEFLDGVTSKTIEGVTRYEYEYIFNTDLLIQSINNGIANGSTYGKTMATGFIARGYMNLNGTTNTDRNEIFLSSGEYQTKVYATQTSTSSHESVENGEISSNTTDKEHCLATAFYGNINTTGTLQNINVYASNYDIAATRELGSFGAGDVHAAGFVAYTSGVNLTNISMYLNDSYIKGHSLSYEVHNEQEGYNNCYVGGVVGAFNGTQSAKNILTNITFAGDYDHASYVTSGTTSKVEGIQNTKGDDDYTNENYVGGIVGRMRFADANGLYFKGSSSDEDEIISLTHENPASAFCGGAIGYIRNDIQRTINISNIEVTDTNIYVGATVIQKVGSHPDIYVGGALGAIYHSDKGGTLNLSNVIIDNLDIFGDGFENVMLFVGGVMGTCCWSGTANISNAYVINSNFISNLYVNTQITNPSSNGIFSCAAGIVGRSLSTTTISNSVVIDTNIESNYINNYGNHGVKTTVSSSGVYGNLEGESITIQNTYSNATLKSDGNCYGITTHNGSHNNVYYVQQNAGGTSGVGVALDFSNKEVAENNTNIFTNLVYNTSNKYYIDIDNKANFISAVNNTTGVVYVSPLKDDVSSFADIWINAKAGGDSKNPSDYGNEDALIEAGWFNLGSLVVYIGDATTSEDIISSTQYSLVDDISEYEFLNSDTETSLSTFENINYPHNNISTNEYLIKSTNADYKINKGSLVNVSIINVIDVKIVSNMRQFKISLNVSPTEYYPALFDKDGNLINTNGLNYDEYGTFDYVIEGNKYVITYQPNESINHDDTFYIGFVNAAGAVLPSCYQFDIKHNATELVGVIYADYTKPLNYQDITFSNTKYIEGNTDHIIYKLRANKIIKLLPVFKMSNEEGLHISELNVSKVSYSSTDGTMKSNGELTAPGSGTGIVTISYTEGESTQTFKIEFIVVSEVNVTYTSVGADIDALTYATVNNDYYMGIDLLDHYGGAPVKFNVTYNGNAEENIFESPKLPDKTATLNLNLGGAAGTITLLFSKDDGETWEEEVQNITVETTYRDYAIDIGGKEYTNFKLVNTIGLEIGISAYKALIKGTEESTPVANIQNSTVGGNTVVDTDGNQMFTMTNGTVTQVVKDGAILGGVISDYSRYLSALNVDFNGSVSKIIVEGLVYTYERSGWSGDWVETGWEQFIDISTSNDTITFEYGDRTDGATRIKEVRLTIIDPSYDFEITSIQYARDGDTNPTRTFNLNNALYTNYNENVIIVNGDATFTFNGTLQSTPTVVADSDISVQSIKGNTYNLSGTNLKITSLSATITNDTIHTYTFASADTANQTATFTYSKGDTVKAKITGCTESGNNLLLYRTGNIVKDKDAVLAWIKDEAGNPVTSWDIEDTNYKLLIPASVIQTMSADTTIEIDIEFPIVYTVSFDLQSDSFNPENTGETFISFKVEAGTTFGELFGKSDNPTDNLNRIGEAVNRAKLFGFVFGGFYLIDNGNTLDAYSMSFGDLLDTKNDLEIHSSYMYYARWSFLIEHIEAPGTTITPSFEAGFLEDLGLTKPERDELLLSGQITIPINNKRGYVFTVEKEEGFIGEAQVNAYIVDGAGHYDNDGNGECDECGEGMLDVGQVREVQIEKYHENMYLYYIPSEVITGYLVIVSNVTNSSIIVGKNTASVTEQILPEDGVYTFKYVVNHKKDESYIYDTEADLLGVKKNILIEFKQQSYDGSSTSIIDRTLPEGTTIEAYYSLYRNGNLSEQTIGVFTANGDEKNVTLDQFTKWNQSEKAFNTDSTFRVFLGSDETVSEVFYFVVTPPNGYNPNFTEKGNEIINDIIYVGYCKDDKTTYLEGKRNHNDIINLPLDELINVTVQKESSKQEKIYSVTPSRQTSLTNDGDNYTFTDNTTYHIADLTVTNGSYADDKLVLYDDKENNTVVTSSVITGDIRELGLKLGYGTGTIQVSGKKDEHSDWEVISSFNVESAEYTYYYVDFEAKAIENGYDYKYFKVDNVSLNEIRLEAFSYSTISNAMLYEFNIADASVSGDVYSFINEIVGDTRHDGKSFVLELEFDNVTDISNTVAIEINGDTYLAELAERDGKVRAYFNLSKIIEDLEVNTITFKINNGGETLKVVRLLEASTAQKPAVSEIRETITK